MKIFDCFTFFNELDLLEFRLKLLDPFVDHFVLAESDLTFSGKDKPYIFEENKTRYKLWLPKIIHIKTSQDKTGLDFSAIENSYNPQSPSFIMEYRQRNTLSQAAGVMNDEDLVLLGDIDEIPDPARIKRINPAKGPVVLSMLFHYYFLNCQNTGHERWWNGTIVTTGKQFKATTAQALRDKRNELPSVKKSGWHFSYLGGVEKIKQKIQSFAHTEFNKEEYLDDKNIIQALSEGTDILKREGVRFKFVPLGYYPSFLQKVMKQYPALVHLQKTNLLTDLYYTGRRIIKGNY